MEKRDHSNFLAKIVERKRLEVQKLKDVLSKNPSHPINAIMRHDNSGHTRVFENAIRSKSQLCVIAEIKRKSPSVGDFKFIPDMCALAQEYERGGASCISCLTDEAFAGSVEDLNIVSGAVSVPVLRKDFIVDKVQIAEAIYNGAKAVLLIVAVLMDLTPNFVRYCEELGIDALVEVHDEDDLAIAIASKARIIGVNNRNLKTFDVTLETSEHLIPLIPDTCVKVAESGIRTDKDCRRMAASGASAVLVGEALVNSEDAAKLISQFRG